MVKVMVVVGSVRPVRIGLPIGEWVRDAALADGRFEVDFCDLKELDLPFMDEPKHPRLHEYSQPHTLAWSERVASTDAFIFISPEYNYGYSPALKNAIDHLFVEWNRKPVAFVSYGGASSGSRGVAALRPVMAATGMVAAMAGVEITFVRQHVHEGVFTPADAHTTALTTVLDELALLGPTLGELRQTLTAGQAAAAR
ncbi:NADPH-dependent FMN reductase [Amycolatopsis pithecellobii]|uniref:NADPH-dependent FMN reductase n=1 Tax=Amycolatopsis pithecellobii TaxID=664692 RepID=A0A6N7ZB03_9PSEU|nr:NAD(P)H-dependent oxidoreductase [Amycolatopsis pithecellobii]MTD58941.1 NADPH-dependent FMN reductase [Amycolatopsis pithecellobii]